MRATWVFTVPSTTCNAAAISALEHPWAIRSSTSRSRGVRSSVRASGRGDGRVGGGVLEEEAGRP